MFRGLLDSTRVAASLRRMPGNAPPSNNPTGWCWDHTYIRLPELFFTRSRPVPASQPRLVILNRPLATSLGLDADRLAEDAGLFTGNQIPDGADPIAQAYAGHQFGHFTGLGDGRAILLGEHLAPGGARYDIQLKGSGRTAYSRGGDGRATLGPMLREYLISEAMHALGIPTTRSLAVAATGETVMRDGELPGAVLTRVAASHIRVGTFQWAAAHQDTDALRALADHTLARHFSEIEADASRHIRLLESAIERQAALVAKWLHVGFIHGVMNTDNMALSGETIDYGPCAFMDAYDPSTVFSSIDRHGRYAYSQQPDIARWNLARLAEAMLPLLDPNGEKAVEMANAALGGFETRFQYHWLDGMRRKIGLFTVEPGDATLIENLLDWMHKESADFTQTFRVLSNPRAMDESPFTDAGFGEWQRHWLERLNRQSQSPTECASLMRDNNPAVIPRNHRVEEALEAAVMRKDMDVMQRLLEVLAKPYEDPEDSSHASPPPPGSGIYQTFCGT